MAKWADIGCRVSLRHEGIGKATGRKARGREGRQRDEKEGKGTRHTGKVDQPDGRDQETGETGLKASDGQEQDLTRGARQR